MKKVILFSAILMFNIAAMAQNFLGKTQTAVENQLNAEGIEFEGYVNKGGTYSLKFYKEDEVRVYSFNYSGKCESYNILFNDPIKIYNYGKIYSKNGWKQSKLKDYEKEFMNWKFTNQTTIAICYNVLEENKEEVDYEYFISVKYK
jgi:hypothetical protein